jgi:hypothetical protein
MVPEQNGRDSINQQMCYYGVKTEQKWAVADCLSETSLLFSHGYSPSTGSNYFF